MTTAAETTLVKVYVPKETTGKLLEDLRQARKILGLPLLSKENVFLHLAEKHLPQLVEEAQAAAKQTIDGNA